MTETQTSRGPAVPLETIADELRSADKLVVATHLNPDGDAIGSARAMELTLLALDKDVIVYVPDACVPAEYEFIRPSTLTTEIPADMAERTLICVDCGNASRVKNDELLERAQRVLNVDHHGDNTHFGHANHVRATASCAAQLVWDLAGHLGVTPTPELATAVYVGLVTDTGRFQYSNTTPESFELAASLMRAGVDTHDVFSRIFENVGYARTRLLGRALERSLRSEDGLIVATHLRQVDFDECGATEDDAEGIVDALRSVEGTYVAVFLRDLPEGSEHLRKGSLRTTREDIDVSAVARTWTGGGHRQAAGFNTSDDLPAIVDRVDHAIREQLGR
jgi:bifunctional oligoribonuclease and PAP phosphatase NrnA